LAEALEPDKEKKGGLEEGKNKSPAKRIGEKRRITIL